jgi:kynurenine formamidase
MARSKPWYPSRWGKDDQIGAMNYLTSETILNAIKVVKKGQVFSLSHQLEEGMPLNPFHSDFLYSTFRDIPQSQEFLGKIIANKNKVGYMNIRMDMADHSGTHVDGLNHAAIDGKLYNGELASSISTVRGTTRLGIQTMPPLVSRGILVDMTLVHQKLERYTITPDHIRKVLRIEGRKIRRGDTVLIYTGWEKYWMKDNTRFVSLMPGIGIEAAKWLADSEVVAVGSDTQSVEIEPNIKSDEDGIVHQELITVNGIHLVENLKLSGIARKRIFEFLFICLPLKIKGGTGSPVTPIAIV